MLLNSWSIALNIVSVLSCFLIFMAVKTAVRVLRYWHPGSDSNRQIKLEGETWLSSTLVMYGACFQIISLVLLIGATDHFSGFISGAMCATGTLLANDFGMPLLYLKIFTSFYAGLWIVGHRLDISSEEYPLVRFKYLMLLGLLPLVVADTFVQFIYIVQLTPDIITSCCAIVFDNIQPDSSSAGLMSLGLWPLYSISAVLLLLSVFCRRWGGSLMVLVYVVGISVWAVLSVYAMVDVFSSYIYAMPYHKCPFCIVKSEYYFIGYGLYFFLFAALFFGLSAGFVQLFSKTASLSKTVGVQQRHYFLMSSIMLGLYVIAASYHMVLYRLFGGEG